MRCYEEMRGNSALKAPPLLRVHDHQLPFSSLLNTKMLKISFFVCMESFIFGNEVCETPIICSKSSPNLCVLQVRVLASPQLLQPQVARRHRLQPGKAAKHLPYCQLQIRSPGLQHTLLWVADFQTISSSQTEPMCCNSGLAVHLRNHPVMQKGNRREKHASGQSFQCLTNCTDLQSVISLCS